MPSNPERVDARAVLAKVTILTDAGHEVGLGHLTRCISVYDALESLGARCSLIVSGEAPRYATGERRAGTQHWHDPGHVPAIVSGSDCVIIDSYRAPREAYRAVADTVPVAVCFDDTARMSYPHGIVVNGRPEAEALYPGAGPDRIVLAGPAYQVLRREFWDIAPRATRPGVSRVLVVSGGTDIAGARSAMADVAQAAYPEAVIDVVDAPRDAVEMRAAMEAADIAVSASGQTLYELAATGTPVVAVCVAENQRAQAEALDRAGVVILAGTWGDPALGGELSRAMRGLAGASRRSEMSARGQALVDGRGARRLARACVRVILETRLSIAAAIDADEADLLALANDPAVRRMSFTPGPITPGGHHEWLQSTLSSRDRLLLVARDLGRLVGQVRFDIEAKRAIVSISVAESYRGTGIAGRLLARAIALLGEAHPDLEVLEAHVRPGNSASRMLFERAGFFEASDDAALQEDAVVYRRRIEEAAGGASSS